MISSAKYFVILFLTIPVMTSFLMIPGVKHWWQGALRNRGNFFLFALCMATPFASGGEALASVGGNFGAARWIRLGLIFSILTITAIKFLQSPSGRTPIGKTAWAMIAYSLICIASAFWSTEPLVTSWKGLEVLALVLATITICRRIKSEEDLDIIMGMMGLAALFFCTTLILGLIVAPEAAIRFERAGFAMRGVAPAINSNSVSQWGVLLACVAMVPALNKRKEIGKSLMWVLFALGISVALLGHARTSLIAFVGILGIVLFFGKHYAMLTLAGVIAIPIILFSAIQSGIADFMLRGQSTELFFSMSNRLHYWDLAWQAIMERPLFGYGFYSGQRVALGWSTVDSAYLEAFIGLGFIGSIPFILAPIFLAYGLYKSNPWRKRYHPYAIIWLQMVSIYIILLLRSFTSLAFGGLHPNTILFMLVAISTTALIRISKQVQKQEPTNITPVNSGQNDRILRRRR